MFKNILTVLTSLTAGATTTANIALQQIDLLTTKQVLQNSWSYK